MKKLRFVALPRVLSAGQKLFLILAGGSVLGFLAGCTTATNPPPDTRSSLVTTAPPAPRPEVRSAQPSRNHVWVPGYWRLNGNQYEWTSGHWEVPPYAGAVWVAPDWQETRGVSRYLGGHWQ